MENIASLVKKICLRCRCKKNLSEFHPEKRRGDGLNSICKKCINSDHREWKQKNLGKSRGYQRKYYKSESRLNKALKALYGICLEDYNQMFVNQNGLCLICGKLNVAGRRLTVDHDHNSKKVRGLLCNLCNQGLGSFRDNEELLLKAIKYLNKHNGKN